MSDTFPPPPPEQPQPEPRYRSPEQVSPWAAPAVPQRKRRTGLIVTLAVAGGLVVAGGTVALVVSTMSAVQDSIALPPRSDAPYSAPYEDETFDEETVEPAPGPDPEGDVTVATCGRDSLIGWPHADLKIVNRTEGPAAYIVTVSFVDGDGEEVDDGIATTEEIAPGDAVTVRALGSGEVAAGTKCRTGEVERYVP
ncbi:MULTISPECIES: FxLYD domain-containing protein [unclassified Streptomyces]|uniref:FxLYD domain-containing protein n=1 Tax=unclassified Streptomyces TaxID=2593676 RepID=UPI0004BD2E88|nr:MULTISPECIES: FxLYD domain-containing protein [unclassified Streptomyces]